MISNILLFAVFVARPTTEAPKREIPKVVIQTEYAEKPKELVFGDYVGYFYAG